jgi:UDP-N-acetyl-2-amino-2-deoxyglucuronate dehydrogenase
MVWKFSRGGLMSRLRTALVGCGKVGQIHAPALCELPESQFVAVCDPVFERAASLAQRYGVRAFGEVGQLLRDTRPQAVLIATPHPQHAAVAITAADAGAHVLVEKPLAANLRDCDAMLDAARRGGVQLSVISQRRWYPPVRRLQAAIAAGKIGRPVLGVFQMFSHRLQIQEFLRAILEGRPAPIPGEEGRRVVEMFTAIYRSHSEHRPIPFPLDS